MQAIKVAQSNKRKTIKFTDVDRAGEMQVQHISAVQILYTLLRMLHSISAQKELHSAGRAYAHKFVTCQDCMLMGKARKHLLNGLRCSKDVNEWSELRHLVLATVRTDRRLVDVGLKEVLSEDIFAEARGQGPLKDAGKHFLHCKKCRTYSV